jgi:hypothetical protein
VDLRLTPEQQLAAFGAARMVIGGSGWITPSWSGVLFGMRDAGRDPHTALMFRMWGVRDLLLGAALQPGSGVPASAALRAGVVADIADVLAALVQIRRAPRGGRGWGVAAGAGAFASVGVALLLVLDD